MKPETFTAQLKETCGDNLVSVILYGSAVAGDFSGKHSDYNLLVILNRLDFSDLKALTRQTVAWSKKGNPPPLLFTRERLTQSADVFPIEIMDMKQSHRVLLGDDVLDSMEVSDANLRLQVEHELRAKLITLREQYLLTAGRTKPLKELMIQSLSSFLVLFRATLRLFKQEVPARKIDAVKQLADELGFAMNPFEQVSALKQGQPITENVEPLFEKYLTTITEVIDAVDAKVLSD